MEKDYLWLNISSLPYFRGLLRAVEARFYEEIEIVQPVLDLGCGDGHFASVAFEKPLDVGIDPWSNAIQYALSYGGYKFVSQSEGAELPFEDDYFSTVMSNSVLEHIEDLEPVLKEVRRVIKPDGKFVFCVPNHNFLSNLSISNFLDRIGLSTVGNAYRRFFNMISRHHHCDDSETWTKRLNTAGFEVISYWHYFSPKATGVLEWGHYFGLPSLLTRKIFGLWILFPKKWNIFLTERLMRPYYNEPQKTPEGSYSFYIAKKL
ncbi:MAG: class I SAM-dependent methyltransferase [Anaerolineaceae bacterium]|nr:class I SAM-dependent methyltransferase [Anaerolineaceae bacterium]